MDSEQPPLFPSCSGLFASARELSDGEIVSDEDEDKILDQPSWLRNESFKKDVKIVNELKDERKRPIDLDEESSDIEFIKETKKHKKSKKKSDRKERKKRSRSKSRERKKVLM